MRAKHSQYQLKPFLCDEKHNYFQKQVIYIHKAKLAQMTQVQIVNSSHKHRLTLFSGVSMSVLNAGCHCRDEANDLILNHSVLICVCVPFVTVSTDGSISPPPRRDGSVCLVLANFVLYLCLIFFLYFFGYLLHAVL